MSYSNLRFQPGVDWQSVRPQLWQILNAVLAASGKVGTVISGYRTPEHSVAVGGFANDPHTRGIAADVEVGGVPIGSVPGLAQALTVAGLISGAQPNFYKGAPDPAHVQLGGSAGSSAPAPAAASSPPSSAASCLPAALALLGLFGGGVAILGHFL